MATEAEIRLVLITHNADLIDVAADQLAWKWRDELRDVDPSLIPAVVAHRINDPVYGLYRREKPVPAPTGPPSGSLEAIAANYTQRSGLRGPQTGGMTSQPAPAHPALVAPRVQGVDPFAASLQGYLQQELKVANGDSKPIVGRGGREIRCRLSGPRYLG